jgi:transcriptional regulator with XRE-family HTH domain
VDKPHFPSASSATVAYMEKSSTPEEVLNVCKRLRAVRVAKSLTLLDVQQTSGGEVTAVALGSYERGDRQISLSKLLQIARIYGVPASEILTKKIERVEPTRIVFDLRKIRQSRHSEAGKIAQVLNEIAKLRGDWNGEIISIRASDITSLSLFTGLSAAEIQSCVTEYSIPRSK